MAAIWVVFGHSVVTSKNEKWSANNGDLNSGPRLAYPSARPLYHRLPKLRVACGVTRWEGKSNESIYERYGMGPWAKWSEV